MYHSMVGNSGSCPAFTASKLVSSDRITSFSSGRRCVVVPNWPRSSGRQVNLGSPESARFTLKVEPSLR